MRDDGDFLKDLRAEIQATQSRRSAYIRHKFAFVIGLLGIGSISIAGPFETLWVLYLVPFVAFSFDLYIFGEDFGIKRAGAFVRKISTDAPEAEKQWEEFVNVNRDPMTKAASTILSLVVLLGAATGLFQSARDSLWYWIWTVLNVIVLVGLQLYRKHLADLEEKFDVFPNTASLSITTLNAHVDGDSE